MREEEKKRTSQKSAFRRFLSKRWALPAIYLACAAVLLTGILWYQTTGNNSANPGDVGYEDSEIAGKGNQEPAVEVNSKVENFSMPVLDENQAVIKKQFYDMNGKKEEQEAALLFYNNQYQPNKGIDVAVKNGETFDVVASLSGTVTKVQEDTLLGNVIEIEHEKGVITRYSSVKDIAVEVGDQVAQGQAIAKAGQSLINEAAGIHVHFEIRKDNVAVNPIEFMDKTVAALKESQVNSEAQEADNGTKEEQSDDDTSKNEDQSEDQNASEDDQPSEDHKQEKQNN